MSDTTIGDHDPVVVQGGHMLGVWVECECGWISSSYYTADSALRVHAHHEKKASGA